MFLLEPEEVIKRIAIAIGCAAIIIAVSFTTWYNLNLKGEFIKNIVLTNTLREQTGRLDNETDTIKNDISKNANELKNSIDRGYQETRKIDEAVKDQELKLKEYKNDIDKFKSETREEIKRINNVHIQLANDIADKEAKLVEQQNSHEKYRSETDEKLRVKEIEIQDLKVKLNAEIEWRNRRYLIR